MWPAKILSESTLIMSHFSEMSYFIPTWEWTQYCRDLYDAHEQFESMASFILLFPKNFHKKCGINDDEVE